MRRTLTGAAGAVLLGLLAALLHGQATTGGGGSQPGVTGAVSSVFGRTGVIAAQTGDYGFSQISGQAVAAQVPNLDLLNGPLSLAQVPQGGATTGQVMCWSGSVWSVCSLSQIAGALNLAQLAQNGASSGNAPVWGGSAWAPGNPTTGGSGGVVSSVFGRTGSVAAQTADYSYAQISGTPVFVDQVVPSGTLDGTNNVFTIPDVPTSGSLALWRNGLLMQNGSGKDYTLSGSTISFTAGAIPTAGSVLLASYRK